jgi:hypothetical protein
MAFAVNGPFVQQPTESTGELLVEPIQVVGSHLINDHVHHQPGLRLCCNRHQEYS